jgi:protein-arginine kinase activator protein McsA
VELDPSDAAAQGEGRLHGEVVVPERVRELQGFLQMAIAVEDYERAAAIRDRLAAVRRKRKSPQTTKLPQRSRL